MSKSYLFIIVFGLILAACGGNSATNTNVNANSNSNAAVSNSTAAGSNATPTATVNANANTKPTDNSPKRIAFNKGANWGAANITLAPGAAQRFVVSAKSGQILDVEVSSKETSVNLIKGKAQTTEDFGYLNAELQANGDYIFEVKNSTKKEIKTSVKVTIEGGKTAENEIDESDSTVMEDDDVPAPPDKKDN